MADLAPTSASQIVTGGLLGPLARTQYGALVRLRWRMFSNSMRTSKGGLELGARTFSYLVYATLGLTMGAGAPVTSGDSCPSSSGSLPLSGK
jgi:hypothetical protein